MQFIFWIFLLQTSHAKTYFAHLPSPLRDVICAKLLQTSPRDLNSPLMPESVALILEQMYRPPSLNQEGLRRKSLRHPRVQAQIAQIGDLFSSLPDPLNRRATQAFGDLTGLGHSSELVFYSPRTVSLSESTEILDRAYGILNRVPVRFRQWVGAAGRHVELVHGQIVDHPNCEEFRGQFFQPGCKLDDLPGCARSTWSGNAYVITESLLQTERSTFLHEYFHLIDYVGADLFGGAFSDLASFRVAFRKSKWAWQDWHYASARSESFAEAGARFYFSPQSRERLRTEQPALYHFFSTF